MRRWPGARGSRCRTDEQLGGFEHGVLAVALHQLGNAPLAQARGADLAAQVADDQRRGAAIGRDHGFDFFDRLEARHEFHRRQMQPFLENLPRVAGAAAGHGAADIALVRHVGGEADPIASVEDRREHAHVRRVGTAAEIRMIGDERVAGVDLVSAKVFRIAAAQAGKAPM